jgi:hypothetical protein
VQAGNGGGQSSHELKVAKRKGTDSGGKGRQTSGREMTKRQLGAEENEADKRRGERKDKKGDKRKDEERGNTARNRQLADGRFKSRIERKKSSGTRSGDKLGKAPGT